ncbi:MAG: alanine--tRNA ligase [Dehalococcoidia bacterium]
MNSEQIRESFLNYFESQNHLRYPSSSLIPVGDPTLLLTNAGMVQFKSFFSGDEEPPSHLLTTSQKCFRTVDIDEVGDSTHLTFFEMLGNFSIGKYFKQDAIRYSIDYLTNVLKLDIQKLYITIHDSDDESSEYWNEVGIPNERIYKFGSEDNWWGPAGSEGPCGPCSELHYDFGDSVPQCGLESCGPNCEAIINDNGDTCERIIELWNLVFMQFYQDESGSRKLLPAPSVDTGMGFERLAVIMQKARNIYETDLFMPIIKLIEENSEKKYHNNELDDVAFRIVSEHMRSSTFLIGDGVIPGNEGRSYVLRRILRRAIRYSDKLNLAPNTLIEISKFIISNMNKWYPELKVNEDFIYSVIEQEQEKFSLVFQRGLNELHNFFESNKSSDINSKLLFKLWDTYGFPVELTSEIATENNVNVDMNGFRSLMDNQKKRSRESSRFETSMSKIDEYKKTNVSQIKFVGYENLNKHSTIVGILQNDKFVNTINPNEKNIEIITDSTTFYPEGGGQVGDSGIIFNDNFKFQVKDTQEIIKGIITHIGILKSGQVSIGDKVVNQVDEQNRKDSGRNHTATHLLHSALRKRLGNHVRQAGSLVEPDRLRFDFSHPKSLTKSEIKDVENLVSNQITLNSNIRKSEDKYNDAIKRGALAFFGDRYDQTVRLIEIGDDQTFSFEVCGGTHVKSTGELGDFIIVSESSIGAGLRRIEAYSGRKAKEYLELKLEAINSLCEQLNCKPNEIIKKIEVLTNDLDVLSKQIETYKNKIISVLAKDLAANAINQNEIHTISKVVEIEPAMLRELSDQIQDHIPDSVIILGTPTLKGPVVIVKVTKNAIKIGYDARKIVKNISEIIDGRGGGKPEMAQVGGDDNSKLKNIENIDFLLILEN